MRLPRQVGLVFLPGDEILYWTAEATARDAQLTRAELRVRILTWRCCQYRRNVPSWKCSSEAPCRFCAEIRELCD